MFRARDGDGRRAVQAGQVSQRRGQHFQIGIGGAVDPLVNGLLQRRAEQIEGQRNSATEDDLCRIQYIDCHSDVLGEQFPF